MLILFVSQGAGCLKSKEILEEQRWIYLKKVNVYEIGSKTFTGSVCHENFNIFV